MNDYSKLKQAIDTFDEKGFHVIGLQREENEMEHEIGYIFQPLQIDNIFSIDKHDDLLCHLKKEILPRKIIRLKK